MKKETLEQIVSKQFQKEFNKEVKNVLVQELKKLEMKQTAVEWLYKNLLENPISNQDVEYNEAVFHNAKEMEKQQQGYSEEEVIQLLQKALTHQDDGETGSLVTAQGEIRTANFFSWFQKFKKK